MFTIMRVYEHVQYGILLSNTAVSLLWTALSVECDRQKKKFSRPPHLLWQNKIIHQRKICLPSSVYWLVSIQKKRSDLFKYMFGGAKNILSYLLIRLRNCAHQSKQIFIQNVGNDSLLSSQSSYCYCDLRTSKYLRIGIDQLNIYNITKKAPKKHWQSGGKSKFSLKYRTS